MLPTIPPELIDAGGWVVALSVALAWIGSIMLGRLVPKSVYEREIKRADVATTQLERNTEATAEVAGDLHVLLQLLKDVIDLPVKGR